MELYIEYVCVYCIITSQIYKQKVRRGPEYNGYQAISRKGKTDPTTVK